MPRTLFILLIPVPRCSILPWQKLAASEMASWVVDRCVQMEKLYRQARPMRVYEGASEVLRLGIARQLTEEVS